MDERTMLLAAVGALTSAVIFMWRRQDMDHKECEVSRLVQSKRFEYMLIRVTTLEVTMRAAGMEVPATPAFSHDTAIQQARDITNAIPISTNPVP